MALPLLAVLAVSFAYTATMGHVARSMEAKSQSEKIQVFAQSLRGRRIVIDPGHGGVDPGAISTTGQDEAMLNLQMAKLLGAMLESAGATVIYTRENGEDLSGFSSDASVASIDYRERKVNDLHARMALIRDVQPDLVISIHCNATVSSRWRGAQTFFDGERGARREESAALAADVQHALREFTETRRWANSGIGHLILDASPAPAITVEAGFLSNPEEARLLANPEYQRRVAFAVFLGVARWSAGIRVTDPIAGVWWARSIPG